MKRNDVKEKKRILIIESRSFLRIHLFRLLSQKGYQVTTAKSSTEAYTLSQSHKFLDIVLIDSHLFNDAKELLNRYSPDLKIIILADPPYTKPSHKNISHIFIKPFQTEDLIQTIESITKPTLQHKFKNIIGHSLELQKALHLVEKVAQSDSTVLITGESGTGKELIAKAVHLHSPRAKAPFIAINCGAIPSELLESELFGHTKGAFTNAFSHRTGRFELAENGTIFFDEIGDMSPQLQVKLLRVLQEKTFDPIGSTKTIPSNVRVITATNINLEKAVSEGRFREDLYYRLNVIPIHVPPLKKRLNDIPLLLQHFVKKFNHEHHKNIDGITPQALEVLAQYTWPGNIRELENLIERLTILKGEGLIDTNDLPINYFSTQDTSPHPIEIPQMGMDFNSSVDAYENTLILQALERTGWNRNQAAILLNLNRTTLVEKIKKKGLRPPDKNNPCSTQKIDLRRLNQT